MPRLRLPQLDDQMLYSDRSGFPSAPCVYLVFDDKSMHYIGKTANLRQRFSSHSRRSQFVKLGNSLRVGWVKEDGAIADTLESAFIGEFSPVLNNTMPPQQGNSAAKSISMPKWLWNALRKRSVDEDRSMSHVMQRAVKFYLKNTTTATLLGIINNDQIEQAHRKELEK